MELISKSTIFLVVSLTSLLSIFSAEAIRVSPESVSSAPSSSPSPSPTESHHFLPEEIPSSTLPTFSSPSSSSSSIDPGLLKVCGVTENPRKCAASIAPFLSSGATDPVSVLEMDIEVLFKEVKHAISIARRMSEAYSSTPSNTVATCLDTCVQFYDKVIEDLATAMTACSAQDIGTVNAMLSSAISKFGSCDEEFSKRGSLDSLMEGVDQTMIELSGYGLDISNKLIL